MTTENAIRDHQTWINYLQPDGLVVSAAALVDAQVYLDRDAAECQREFTQFVQEVEVADRDVAAVQDLRQLLAEFLDWPKELVVGLSAERPVPSNLTVGLPELNETLTPTLALADIGPDETAPSWLLLVKEVTVGTNLDARETGRDSTWSASATQKLERLLRETGVPIGVLSNGTQLRLLYAPRGENSGSLTFPVQWMTEVAGRSILSAFWGLLSKERLLAGPAEARLPALLVKSREYQVTVSKELAGQVLDALYELVRGLQAADAHTRGELLKEILAEHPDEVYRALLTVLLRLIFLLFAEDRALLPTSELYAANYSIHGLFARLRADAQKYPDTMDHRYGAWAQLVALFRAVYGGSRHPQLKMPPRKGFLFDPGRFPFLEGRQGAEDGQRLPLVADGVVYRVLEKLLLLGGERLSYRTLDVEQIGSVYETMMGFRLEKTSGRTIALKAGKSGGAPVAIDLDALLKQKPTERAKYLAVSADLKLTGKAAEGLGDASSLDQLLSTLERRIARNATPDILPPGNMVLQPTDERRRTGSHYTARSLTEPCVRTTLRPILDRLGPNPKPDQILDLKVCDLGVGSGAFLVETCRQLGDALLHAWHAHGAMPYIPPDEDEVLHARRVVAQRCLYGVDKNPMAVDLTKLSLWLATLAKDHPFTFLDHAIRCGDSLVGLTARQIADFHWLPEKKRVFGQEFLEQRIATATTQRQLILTLDDDLTGPEKKLERLHLADEALNIVREAGDLVIAAFFAGENAKTRALNREDNLAQFTEFYRVFDLKLNPGPIVKNLREGDHPVTPFHWEIEFPEVFAAGRNGFDAIVGNPPFLGGSRLSSIAGKPYMAWMAGSYPESRGKSDLVAYFFRRVYNLLHVGGAAGLIATKTIRQGDTRYTGLRWIRRQGGWIYEADLHRRWPGMAAVVVSVVHFCRERHTTVSPVLNGRQVNEITAYLFHFGPDENPSSLSANQHRAYSGVNINGKGFVLSPAEKDCLVQQDPLASERIRPYLGGEDINELPEAGHVRYVAYMEGLATEADVKRWPSLYQHLSTTVKLQRATSNERRLREFWWLYSRPARDLYDSLVRKTRVLASGRVSEHLGFVFTPPHLVFSDSLTLFLFEDYAAFCVLQGRAHEVWARFFGSSLEDRNRYIPEDCFETFPLPPAWETSSTLEENGRAYYEFRAVLMARNGEGLTATYNRFHDPRETDPDILRLRGLHDAMDRAVLDAYGWTGPIPPCEFFLDYEDEEDEETSSRKKKPWRYRWPDEFRDEVLARLLALNTLRAEEERLAGEAETSRSGKAGGKSRKKEHGEAPSGALFDS